MRSIFRSLLVCAAVTSFPVFASAQAPAAPQAKPAQGAEEHEHGHHGPHEGELLEVGNDEFHVEVCVDDEKNEMKVYLLDKEVKKYVAIEQPQIVVNMKVQAKPVQFKLKPAPQENDPKGFSSAFQLTNADLVKGLHAEESDARLVFKIGTKQYNVKVIHEHDHDHEGHDHDHGDHKGHNHGPASKK